MRILVAEDEVVTVELYAAVLEERGHKVYVTYDGQQALNVYKNSSQPFDVIVLDYKLPLLNGLQVAMQIFEINPNQRIIFTSAYVFDTLSEAVKGLKRVVELIQKPFLPEILVNQVEDVAATQKIQEMNTNMIRDGNNIENLLQQLRALQTPKTI